ncbi:uncharacterized protein LOC5510923 [Nematostella vectensis]|uniref:uncharacterized protein LOC5510923 n=1 Tax=Nematostella vectensis TaxID=45351 RepID=UPI002077757A|nr:uncharacterized protein LOC5510923 [Nematostella vectensis]
MASYLLILVKLFALLPLSTLVAHPAVLKGNSNVPMYTRRTRPRSEIDLTTDKQVLICAGQNKSLECVSPGSSISIMDTFWGRLTDKLCPSEDGDPSTDCMSDPATTGLVKQLCDNKVFCQVAARHTVLQRPGTQHCPGINKYLIVNYTCIPDQHKLVLCNGETTQLHCGQGWKLNILTAFWGRTSVLTCPTPLDHPSRFATCQNMNSTTANLQRICQGRAECIVRADDLHMARGKSYCPDVEKYAMLSYRCQPSVNQGVFADDLSQQPSQAGPQSESPESLANSQGNSHEMTEFEHTELQQHDGNVLQQALAVLGTTAQTHRGHKADKDNGDNYNHADNSQIQGENGQIHAQNGQTHSNNVKTPTRNGESQDQYDQTHAQNNGNMNLGTPQQQTELRIDAATSAGRGVSNNALAALLHEYLVTQARNHANETADKELAVPHDPHPTPLLHSDKISVPQDNKNEPLPKHYEILKKILQNKHLSRITSDELVGNVTSVLQTSTRPNFGRRPTSDNQAGNGSSGPPRPTSGQSTSHVTHTPSGGIGGSQAGNASMTSSSKIIKLLSEYSHKNEDEVKALLWKLKDNLEQRRRAKKQGNTVAAVKPIASILTIQHQAPVNLPNGNSNQQSLGQAQTSNEDNSRGSEGTSNDHMDGLFSQSKPTMDNKQTQSSLSTADIQDSLGNTKMPTPQTASLGGTVKGTTFYEKYLKAAMKEEAEGAIKQEQKGQAALSALSEKVKALQTISDALNLLTERITPEENGGKRHGTETLDNVDQKDIDFLQKKINDAIDMAESMGRHEIAQNPNLVALRIAGRVPQDVTGSTRNTVQKDIQGIEDSLKSFVESVEATGNSDRRSAPTVSAFNKQSTSLMKTTEPTVANKHQYSSMSKQEGYPSLKQESSEASSTVTDGFTKAADPITKVTKAFEKAANPATYSANPISKSPDPAAKSVNTVTKTTDNSTKNADSATKAADTVANGQRRGKTDMEEMTSHFVSKNFTVALQPVTTFQDFNEVKVGGRINNEIIKEKEKEKLYKGQSVDDLLKMLKKKRPSSNVPIPVNVSTPVKVKSPFTGKRLDNNTLSLMERVVQHLLKDERKAKELRKKHKHEHKPQKDDEEKDDDDKDDDVYFDFDSTPRFTGQELDAQNAGKKDKLDKSLLEELVEQLDKAQSLSTSINGVPSSMRGSDYDTIRVPTDQKPDNKSDGVANMLEPAKKPAHITSDDDLMEIVNKYVGSAATSGTVQNDLKVSESASYKPSSYKAEDAEKTSLKPHAITFSAAEMSGKIGTNEDEPGPTKSAPILAEVAGGKIIESQTGGLEPMAKETFAVIHLKPTTKSTTSRVMDPTTRANIGKQRKLKISNLVKGVRMLLKALKKISPEHNEGESTSEYRTRDAQLDKHLKELDSEFDDVPTKGYSDFQDKHGKDWYYGKYKDEVLGGSATPKTPSGYGYYEYGDMNQDPYYQTKDKGSSLYTGTALQGDPIYPGPTQQGNSMYPGTTQQLLDYDAQYDKSIIKQLSSSLGEYSTVGTGDNTREYTSLGTGDSAQAYSPLSTAPFYDYGYRPQNYNFMNPETRASLDAPNAPKLPKKIRHALSKALRSDPVMKVVESFAKEETHLMNERLKGVTKHSRIAEKHVRND